MTFPPLRVRVGDLPVTSGIMEAVLRVLASGRFTEGPETRAFEREWAAAVGVERAVAVSSGTSALEVGIAALLHARPRAGRVVVTTPLTYAADLNAVLLAGLEPAFVDVDPGTFCMRPEEAARACEELGDDLALALPVHLMGYPAEAVPAVSRACREAGAPVLEDAAQAHGALVGGRRAGAWGDASIFSFFMAHNVQAGELGAICTGSDEVARACRRLKANGRECACPECTRGAGSCPALSRGGPDPRFNHVAVGRNAKADEWTTAIARAQIARVDDIIQSRRRTFAALRDRLARHAGWLRLPQPVEGMSPFAFPVVLRPGAPPRGDLALALAAAGVESRPLFGCLPTQQPAYAGLAARWRGRLPAAEEAGSRGLYVGCHQGVTDEDVEFVGRAFDGFARDRGLVR